MSDEFLTVYEVAELLKLNPQTVRNWIDRGELGAVRVGPRWVRVLRSELDRYIAAAKRPDAEEGRVEFEQALTLLEGASDDAARPVALRRVSRTSASWAKALSRTA